MSLDVVVVMDPIGSIKIAKDSTFAMLLEAQRRGHRLHYVLPGGAVGARRRARGRTVAPLEVRDDATRLVQNWASRHGLRSAARRRGADAQGPAGRRRLPPRHPDPRRWPSAPARWWSTIRRACATCNEKLAALHSRSAARRPWSAATPPRSRPSSPNTARRCSSRWTAWAGARSSAPAPATPTST